jgi:hypothetical protein
MKVRFGTFIYLLFLSNLANSADAWDSLAKRVADTFRNSEKTLLALGETTYEEPAVEQFVRELVQYLGFHISYIAIQSPDSSYQDEIDAFIEGKSIILSQKQLLPLLTSVRLINDYRRQLNFPKLKVIALDLPTDDYSNEGVWFDARDSHMFEVLQEKSEDFKEKGLLWMGAAHVSASAVQLPKVSRRLLENDRTYMKGLGSLLQIRLGKQYIMRVLVHMRMPLVQRFSMLPSDYKESYKLFDSFEEATFIRSNSDKVHVAEHAFENGRSGMIYPISNNFDYLLRLPNSRNRFRECVDLLTSPGAIVKGIALKMLSR